jgi:hypothetical protein
MVNKGNHPKIALFQVCELLLFARIYIYIISTKNCGKIVHVINLLTKQEGKQDMFEH